MKAIVGHGISPAQCEMEMLPEPQRPNNPITQMAMRKSGSVIKISPAHFQSCRSLLGGYRRDNQPQRS